VKQSYDNIPINSNSSEKFEVVFVAIDSPFKYSTLAKIDKIFVIPFNIDKSELLFNSKRNLLSESQKK
jgi:hypothetical protein